MIRRPLWLAGLLAAGCSAGLPPEPAGQPTTVVIDTPYHQSFRAEVVRDGAVVARCDEPPCRLALKTGRYDLHVIGEWPVPATAREVVVRATGTRVEVTPGNSVGRVVGMTMGIGGLLALAGGAFLLGGSDSANHKGLNVGLLLGGLVGTALGWPFYFASGTSIRTVNRSPSIEPLSFQF